MQKTLVAFVCLLLSLPAAALPERSDLLIQSMISKSSPLANLIDQIVQKSDSRFEPVFYSLKIKAALASQQLRTACQEFSRSAGFLKVEINLGHEIKSYFFSTTGSSEKLTLCPNQ